MKSGEFQSLGKDGQARVKSDKVESDRVISVEIVSGDVGSIQVGEGSDGALLGRLFESDLLKSGEVGLVRSVRTKSVLSPTNSVS